MSDFLLPYIISFMCELRPSPVREKGDRGAVEEVLKMRQA